VREHVPGVVVELAGVIVMDVQAVALVVLTAVTGAVRDIVRIIVLHPVQHLVREPVRAIVITHVQLPLGLLK
jgi:hypothetical protein